MKLLKTLAVMAAFVCGNLSAQAQIVAPEHLSDTHTMLRVNPTQRFLLIPVEEKEENLLTVVGVSVFTTTGSIHYSY